MRLLSVDDSMVVRKIIKAAVAVLDFDLEEAENSIEAFEILDKFNGVIDLVLLDWNMPGLSGYELLNALKKDIKYREIPVMMVTAESSKESIVNAIEAGAVNYMVKPFTMEELIKKIMECIGKGEA
ncbi:MAG: response regulator [Clostridiales bacterium]